MTFEMFEEKVKAAGGRNKLAKIDKKTYLLAKKNGWLKLIPKHRLWSEETVKLEAEKYKTRSEFLLKSPSAYAAAKKMGIYEKLVSSYNNPDKRSLRSQYTDNIYWTPELVLQEAKKYTTKTEFSKKSNGAYLKAREYGLLSLIGSEMKIRKNNKN